MTQSNRSILLSAPTPGCPSLVNYLHPLLHHMRLSTGSLYRFYRHEIEEEVLEEASGDIFPKCAKQRPIKTSAYKATPSSTNYNSMQVVEDRQ